jgi:hypothetical protein
VLQTICHIIHGADTLVSVTVSNCTSSLTCTADHGSRCCCCCWARRLLAHRPMPACVLNLILRVSTGLLAQYLHRF